MAYKFHFDTCKLKLANILKVKIAASRIAEAPFKDSKLADSKLATLNDFEIQVKISSCSNNLVIAKDSTLRNLLDLVTGWISAAHSLKIESIGDERIRSGRGQARS